MKNNVVLISAACGLALGIAATACVIVGFGGQLMYFLSLGFILNHLGLSDENHLIAMITLFIIVWTIYGAIIGVLLNKFKKA